jgi:hypothetical protein
MVASLPAVQSGTLMVTVSSPTGKLVGIEGASFMAT